eukprot:1642336-Prymnesium_polylepis.1
MQHCGALMSKARGVQSLKPFAATLHDVCGSVGWQQNPPFDQWELPIRDSTFSSRTGGLHNRAPRKKGCVTQNASCPTHWLACSHNLLGPAMRLQVPQRRS